MQPAIYRAADAGESVIPTLQQNGGPENQLHSEGNHRVAYREHFFPHRNILETGTGGHDVSLSRLSYLLIGPHFLLVENVNRRVVLDADNHGFEDVYVPAVCDSEPNHLVGFREKAATQRHAQISRDDSKNNRLPYPNRVTTLHWRASWKSLHRTTEILRRAADWANGTVG
jgi:hypothetical protein